MRMWIYLFYGAALAMAVALFGWVLWVMLRGDAGEFTSTQPTQPTAQNAVRLKP
ncbi:MAG: hypothetical protein HC853_15965 [Anaerolineae bacterium]|nr:hypothetical protein [Anaerolineae bacterium]